MRQRTKRKEAIRFRFYTANFNAETEDDIMKYVLFILFSILPVAVLAAGTGQDSAAAAGAQAASDAKPSPGQAQPAFTYEMIDPLPVSGKKCLAVDKKGFCSQWATN